MVKFPVLTNIHGKPDKFGTVCVIAGIVMLIAIILLFAYIACDSMVRHAGFLPLYVYENVTILEKTVTNTNFYAFTDNGAYYIDPDIYGYIHSNITYTIKHGVHDTTIIEAIPVN